MGEAPNASAGRDEDPLTGRPAVVMAKMANLVPSGAEEAECNAAMREAYDLVNLLPEHPGKGSGKGSAWDAAAAKKAAARLPLSRVSVLLGKRVAAAYGVRPVFWDWQAWTEDCGVDPETQVPVIEPRFAVVLPHPSGINRVLNEVQNRILYGQTLRHARWAAAEGLDPRIVVG